MAIKPLYDRVLLKRSEPAETGKGGIIIPDTAKEKPMEAEVVAVGEGKYAEDGSKPDGRDEKGMAMKGCDSGQRQSEEYEFCRDSK